MFLPGRASFVSLNQILSDPLGLIKIVVCSVLVMMPRVLLISYPKMRILTKQNSGQLINIG